MRMISVARTSCRDRNLRCERATTFCGNHQSPITEGLAGVAVSVVETTHFIIRALVTKCSDASALKSQDEKG